jgi:hypothetical protein
MHAHSMQSSLQDRISLSQVGLDTTHQLGPGHDAEQAAAELAAHHLFKWQSTTQSLHVPQFSLQPWPSAPSFG